MCFSFFSTEGLYQYVLYFSVVFSVPVLFSLAQFFTFQGSFLFSKVPLKHSIVVAFYPHLEHITHAHSLWPGYNTRSHKHHSEALSASRRATLASGHCPLYCPLAMVPWWRWERQCPSCRNRRGNVLLIRLYTMDLCTHVTATEIS